MKGLKKRHIPVLTIFAYLFALFLPAPVYGGGLIIYEDTVTINGKQENLLFAPGQELNIRYSAQDYSYSGYQGEFGYHVFLLSPKIAIKNSVGLGATNHKQDVEKMQKALNLLGFFDDNTEGIVTQELYDAIFRFQKSIGFSRPDSRIDPFGKTLESILKSFSSYFVVPARLYDPENHSQQTSLTANFTAPQFPGTYEVLYSRITLFSKQNISNNNLSSHELSEVSTHFQHWKTSIGTGIVASLDIHQQEEAFGQDIAVYVRVNDKLPYEANIKPGVHENPIIFTWHVEPKFSKENISFQYRLYPSQDWSHFIPSTEAKYFFLSEGQHEFQVRARYQNGIDYKYTPIARVSFALQDAFISQPTKAVGGLVVEEEKPNIDELYSESYALIIGVTHFADDRLSPLPFVSNDVQLITNVLERHGFQVNTLVGQITKAEIMTKLGSFLSNLQPDSRVIIYFSTHGIQHQLVKSRAYLAGIDCSLDQLDDTCISLSSLEDRLSVPLALPVKHTVILLDACASGLGVFLKSSDYRETQIASERGAHMITAGTADQLAQADIREGVSYFTKFLVKGLNGEADYTEDSIISLNELLLYTRYHVARSTNGTQSPMMGRVIGPGEMIFDLTSLRTTDEH